MITYRFVILDCGKVRYYKERVPYLENLVGDPRNWYETILLDKLYDDDDSLNFIL